MTPEDIVKRLGVLETDRKNVEGLWQDLERWVHPFRGDFFYVTEQEGEKDWRRRDVYDNTAMCAADHLAASIQANLMPESSRWFDLEFQDKELGKEEENKTWLEDGADLTFRTLNESNFNLSSAESVLDTVVFGNGFLVEEEMDSEIEFTAMPLKECYFEEGYDGNIKHFYRSMQWTVVQVVDKFGIDSVPDTIKSRYAADKADTEKVNVIFAVYAVDANKNNDISTILAPDKRPYGYKYVLRAGAEQLGESGGYYEMPVFNPRWRKATGSRHGYGPGSRIIDIIKTLNEWVETTLESAAKAVDPPLMATQGGIVSDLEAVRGGITVVSSLDQIGQFPVGGDFQMANLEVADMRMMIRREFYEDQLELKESPAMTATEVNVRYELMQKLLGPTMGRLQADFLDPLIQRTFNILYRNGTIPPAPEGLEGSDLKINYVGPLPRAQKEEEARNTVSWLGIVGQFVELWPELRNLPKPDDALRFIGARMGVPSTSMANEAEYQKLKQEDEAMMQEAQQTEQARAKGEAAQSMGAGAQALDPDAIAAVQGGI